MIVILTKTQEEGLGARYEAWFPNGSRIAVTLRSTSPPDKLVVEIPKADEGVYLELN